MNNTTSSEFAPQSCTSWKLAGALKRGAERTEALRRAGSAEANRPAPPLPFPEGGAPQPPEEKEGPPPLLPLSTDSTSRPVRWSSKVGPLDSENDSEEGNYVEKGNFRRRMASLFSKTANVKRRFSRPSVSATVSGPQKIPNRWMPRFSRISSASVSAAKYDNPTDDECAIVAKEDGAVAKEDVPAADEDMPCTMTSAQINDASMSLFGTVKYDDVEHMQRILRRTRARGAVRHVLGKVNENGESIAHCAALARKVRIVQCLLEYRADPCVRDQNTDFGGDGLWPSQANMIKEELGNAQVIEKTGKTVVYYMSLSGIFHEVFQGLFPASKVNLVRAIAADMERRHKDPALVYAAKFGAEDLFKLLLDHVYMLPQHDTHSIRGGIGVISSQSIRGAALYVACCSGRQRMVELLINSKLPVMDLESRDSAGRTGLFAAASIGDAKIVKLLVDTSANVQSYSEGGRQPLHEAIMRGHSAVVKVLLDAGADSKSRTRDPVKQVDLPQSLAESNKLGLVVETPGSTALEIAHNVGHGECARMIENALQTGTNLKSPSNTMWTRGGSENIVKNFPAQPSNYKKSRSTSILLCNKSQTVKDRIVANDPRFHAEKPPADFTIVDDSLKQMVNVFNKQMVNVSFFNPAHNLYRESNQTAVNCRRAPQ